MKFLTLCFLAMCLLASSSVPAHAELISISSFIFQGLYTLGLPGALANTIANLALPALAIGASIALRGRAPSVKPSDAKSTFETGDSPVIDAIGRVRIGGMQVFGNVDGNGQRYRLIARLQGPIDAVEQYFIGGREVTVESNGDVSSPPWARPGGSWANWLDKRGDGSETAWGQLTASFPDVWTADHRVRGIAQSLVQWVNPGLSEPKFFSLYQNGVPNTEEVVRAALIYDPRTGTTAWSDNGILACPHILRHDPYFTMDAFDWGLIASEADRADALVATRTGAEKRARAWGIWAWETPRADVLHQLLDSIGAELRVTDEGKIWFQLIDDVHTSEIDFTPRDQYEISFRSGPEAVERPNICRVTYYSPERNYDLAEIDLTGIAWAHVQDEIDRYGEKYADIELPFCPSASQAQRIARRRFAMLRGDSGVLVADMVGLAAWGLMYGTVELPDLGDVLACRFEPPRIDDQSGSVEIPFMVWPDLPAWNVLTNEAAAPDVIPEIGYETDMITPDAPTAHLQITYPDGAKEFRTGFILPSQPFTTVEANYRTYTAGLPNAYQSMSEGNSFAWAAVDLAGQTVDTRVRVFNEEDGTYFSPVKNAVPSVSNTACGVATVVSAIADSGSGSATFDAVMKVAELRACAIRLERKIGTGSYSTISTTKARPEQSITLSDSATASGAGTGTEIYWRVTVLTSNGTSGTPLIYSVLILDS